MTLTAGRIWWIFRRDLSRGVRAAWGDYVIRPRIWKWKNPCSARPLQELPVHVLCGREQLDLCAWMLASWTHFTGRNWTVVVHDDGTLPATAGERLAGLGLAVRLIPRPEADERMARALAPFPRCANYRARHPLALKIFDVPSYACSKRFLLLDTDLLFFSNPDEIMRWISSQEEGCWFNEDVADASNVTSTEARQVLEVDLWPRLNSGLCLLQREAVDMPFCEKALAETSILKGPVWRVEQTLFTLCAARWGRGGLLPKSYEVSLGPRRAQGAVARHYVGAVRQRFFAEGMAALAPILLA